MPKNTANHEDQDGMQFTAIDVETANADVGSICQIGIAVFSNGVVTEEWCTLVNPEDDFDDMNVFVHGIEPRMVEGKPTLPEVVDNLRKYLNGSVTVCHTSFDRVAIDRGLRKYGIEPIETCWLDSARVVRRTWKELAESGYGLVSVCKRIGYSFKHHDALEDAKASGHVMVAALEASGIDLQTWLKRVNQPIGLEKAHNGVLREANPEGDLFGEVIVFTGALHMARREAANLAANMGCKVIDAVTKETTILVVGDQDAQRLAGQEKSSKHRKAESLARKGQNIRIIRESDFLALVEQ